MSVNVWARLGVNKGRGKDGGKQKTYTVLPYPVGHSLRSASRETSKRYFYLAF
jgi:hypothetical protein